MTSGSVSAPANGAVQNMISSVSSGNGSGAGIANYLEGLPVTNARVGGAGMSSHVNAMTSSTQLSGAGITSYLDTVNQACDAATGSTAECADAISSYADALSSGAAP